MSFLNLIIWCRLLHNKCFRHNVENKINCCKVVITFFISEFNFWSFSNLLYFRSWRRWRDTFWRTKLNREMGPKCVDCNPGLVPRLLGCARPEEDVTLECSLLSLLASVVLALILAGAIYLGFCIYQKLKNCETNKKMQWILTLECLILTIDKIASTNAPNV